MNRACFTKNTNLHEQNQHASSIRPLKNNLVRMKILIMSLVLLMAAHQVSGQRRSKTEAKDTTQMDPKDAQIDSLMKSSKSLSLQLDSVSGELVKYVGLYDAIKENVLHYKFDPTRSAYLIDSLKASRDSASALLVAIPRSTTQTDSISALLKENIQLKVMLDSARLLVSKNLVPVSPEDLERAKAVSSLKQLKELLDAKIITDTEFVTIKNKYVIKL